MNEGGIVCLGSARHDAHVYSYYNTKSVRVYRYVAITQYGSTVYIK